MKIIEICELVLPEKSEKEILLFKKYKHWLTMNCKIPQEIINNYLHDLNTLKL